MSDFGKLNFAVSFKPQTAFPLDSRTLFYSLEDAKSAARTAERAGSSNTVYYYGMHLVVVDETSGTARKYIIQPNKTLKSIPFVDEVSGGTSYVIGRGLELDEETCELSVKVGAGLKIDEETKALSVDLAYAIVEDENDSKVATSGAVYGYVKKQVGEPLSSI